MVGGTRALWQDSNWQLCLAADWLRQACATLYPPGPSSIKRTKLMAASRVKMAGAGIVPPGLRLSLSFPHPISATHPTSFTFQVSHILSTPLLRPPGCKLQPQYPLQCEKQNHKTYSDDSFLNYIYILQALGVESSFRSKPVLINKSCFPPKNQMRSRQLSCFSCCPGCHVQLQ